VLLIRAGSQTDNIELSSRRANHMSRTWLTSGKVVAVSGPRRASASGYHVGDHGARWSIGRDVPVKTSKTGLRELGSGFGESRSDARRS
jgi:hypothetical protein